MCDAASVLMLGCEYDSPLALPTAANNNNNIVVTHNTNSLGISSCDNTTTTTATTIPAHHHHNNNNNTNNNNNQQPQHNPLLYPQPSYAHHPHYPNHNHNNHNSNGGEATNNMETGEAHALRLFRRLHALQDDWRTALSHRELTPSLFDALLATVHALHTLATTSLLGPPPSSSASLALFASAANNTGGGEDGGGEPPPTALRDRLAQAFGLLSAVPVAEYLQQAGQAAYDPLPPLPRDLMDVQEYLTLFDDHLLCISSRQCVANAKRKTLDALRRLHEQMPSSSQQQQALVVDPRTLATEIECLRVEIARAEHDVALFRAKLAHMLRTVSPVNGLAVRTEIRSLLDAELHALMGQRRRQLVALPCPTC